MIYAANKKFSTPHGLDYFFAFSGFFPQKNCDWR